MKKGVFKDNHYDSQCNFLYTEVDKVTEKVSSCILLLVYCSSCEVTGCRLCSLCSRRR